MMGERKQGGEWIEVTSRRDRRVKAREGQRESRWDIFGRLEDHHRRNAASFFFTEIPENFGARDMFRIFARYGEIKEVVIPAKRNKLGKRYGFARFLYIRDHRRFAIRLDNIIIGSRKIFVNIPRFHRSSGIFMKGDIGGIRNTQLVQRRSREANPVATRNLVHGVSYAEKVKDTNGSGRLPAFVVKEETMKKMEETHVGEVRTPGNTYLIQEELYNKGIFSLKAIPLGANLVLLVDKEPGAFDSMASEFGDWFANKFVKISRWDQKMLDKERVCWIRCIGIPPQAWTNDFFDFISGFVGKFMAASPNTCSLETMDVAFLKIRTSQLDLINLNVEVLINDITFSIRILEVVDGKGLMESVENRKIHEDVSSDEDSFISGTGVDWQEGMFDFLRHDFVEEEEDETIPATIFDKKEEGELAGTQFSNSNLSSNQVERASESLSSAIPDSQVPVTGLVPVNVEDSQTPSMIDLVPVNPKGLTSPRQLCTPAMQPEYDDHGVAPGQIREQAGDVDALVALPSLDCEKRQLNARELSGKYYQNAVPVVSNDEGRSCNIDSNNCVSGKLHVIDESNVTTRKTKPPCGSSKNRKVVRLSERFQEWDSPLGKPSQFAPLLLNKGRNKGVSRKGDRHNSSKMVVRDSNISSSSLSGASVSDTDIQRVNDRIWTSSVAGKVWEGAKSMGVTGIEQDDTYVQRVREIEYRDTKAKGKMGETAQRSR